MQNFRLITFTYVDGINKIVIVHKNCNLELNPKTKLKLLKRLHLRTARYRPTV